MSIWHGVGVAMKAQVITLDTHGHWVASGLRFGNCAFIVFYTTLNLHSEESKIFFS